MILLLLIALSPLWACGCDPLSQLIVCDVADLMFTDSQRLFAAGKQSCKSFAEYFAEIEAIERDCGVQVVDEGTVAYLKRVGYDAAEGHEVGAAEHAIRVFLSNQIYIHKKYYELCDKIKKEGEALWDVPQKVLKKADLWLEWMRPRLTRKERAWELLGWKATPLHAQHRGYPIRASLRNLLGGSPQSEIFQRGMRLYRDCAIFTRFLWRYLSVLSEGAGDQELLDLFLREFDGRVGLLAVRDGLDSSVKEQLEGLAAYVAGVPCVPVPLFGFHWGGTGNVVPHGGQDASSFLCALLGGARVSHRELTFEIYNFPREALYALCVPTLVVVRANNGEDIIYPALLLQDDQEPGDGSISELRLLRCSQGREGVYVDYLTGPFKRLCGYLVSDQYDVRGCEPVERIRKGCLRQWVDKFFT